MVQWKIIENHIFLLSKYCIVEWVHVTLICMQGPVLMQVIQDAVMWASAGGFLCRATATVTWTATSMETVAVTLGRPVNPHSVRKCWSIHDWATLYALVYIITTPRLLQLRKHSLLHCSITMVYSKLSKDNNYSCFIDCMVRLHSVRHVLVFR